MYFSKLFLGAYWYNIYLSPTTPVGTDPGSQSSEISNRLRGYGIQHLLRALMEECRMAACWAKIGIVYYYKYVLRDKNSGLYPKVHYVGTSLRYTQCSTDVDATRDHFGGVV